MSNLGEAAGFNITKPVERKLVAFARRLRLHGNQKGSTNIGADRYEIFAGPGGFTVLSVNGKPNKCLEEA